MKKLLLFICLFALLLSGCQKQEKVFITSVEYSNLASESSMNKTLEIMKNAGIKQENVDMFKAHVTQFNNAVNGENLVGDFETTKDFAPKYDAYKFQDVWNEKYPDFIGYNCRITSFSIFKDFVDVDYTAPIKDDLLFLDKEALDADNSAISSEKDAEKFYRLFSYIETSKDIDTNMQIKKIEEDLAKRVKFKDDKNIRLISVFFHDNIEPEESKLFVGHVGVAIKSDDKIYFVEKIAFQEPYQVNVFDDISSLSDFLMKRYDIEKEPSSTRPIIFDNDKLIDGYRVNP